LEGLLVVETLGIVGLLILIDVGRNCLVIICGVDSYLD